MVEKTGIRNEVGFFDHPTACVQANRNVLTLIIIHLVARHKSLSVFLSLAYQDKMVVLLIIFSSFTKTYLDRTFHCHSRLH